MTVLGVYGGIGSMLQGAKNAGMQIVGNIEPRDFEDGQTFLRNFDQATFRSDFLSIDQWKGKVDVIVGHPSCGSYSAINWRETKVKRDEVENFVAAVQRISPTYFIMDNLPKMFIDYPATFWHLELSNEYDISPVWVNNSNYGNAQVRRRVYIVGSKRDRCFVPVPGENSSARKTTVKDVIGHILGKEGTIPNHYDVNHDDYWSSMTNVLAPETKSTYREMFDHVNEWQEGKSFRYYKKNGSMGTRIGLVKSRWVGRCPTLSSTARQIHPKRCTPFTIREQLLLMGYPEDFEIIGQRVNDDGTWKIRGLEYHQANKGVCVQSIQFFLHQISVYEEEQEYWKEYLDGFFHIEQDFNDHVNKFKYQYCQLPDVTVSSFKCSMCKMRSVCRRAK